MVQKTVTLYGLTVEDFEEALYLDNSSPSGLRWKVTTNSRAVKDSIAGSYSETEDHPFWKMKFNKIPMVVARVIWFMAYKRPPIGVIDHKNGDTRDHRISNLRDVPQRVNCQNRKVETDFGVPGVYLKEDKYGNLIFRCQGVYENGTRWSKVFAVRKYGYDKTLKLAKEYRQLMERRNNVQSRRITLESYV